MRKVDPDVLLSPCELANALNRGDRYVRHMRGAGFKMVGDRASLNHALYFLTLCPTPTTYKGPKIDYSYSGGPN